MCRNIQGFRNLLLKKIDEITTELLRALISSSKTIKLLVRPWYDGFPLVKLQQSRSTLDLTTRFLVFLSVYKYCHFRRYVYCL